MSQRHDLQKTSKLKLVFLNSIKAGHSWEAGAVRLKTAFPPHHMPRQDLPEGRWKRRRKREQEVTVNEPFLSSMKHHSSSMKTNALNVKNSRDWSDGSLVTSTQLSCRGPKFSYQHQCPVVHNYLQLPLQEGLRPLASLGSIHTQTQYTHN